MDLAMGNDKGKGKEKWKGGNGAMGMVVEGRKVRVQWPHKQVCQFSLHRGVGILPA